MPHPVRVFLDTNVFIIGTAEPDSDEAAILKWAGFGQEAPGPVEIIVSTVLFAQILRVGRRLHDKDWGSGGADVAGATAALRDHR